MFLKRVTLHGFKSFADRTEFEFGRGVTAVVGPNGCGKSNIVDAIKWVLGEQSARSLRGHRMADVIFAGSRSRKAAPMAEVQLTFDNHDRMLASEQDEVSVGRQLFRDGTSEYFLNGQPCRLKDIRELFLDTGIGVDAYSFIEQGRVDVLLAANPVERREIFEEAAGISKYKVRRTEAQRKLERSSQNLLRLNDVIEEVEKQLRSVKLAAGKARNYQEYDARLRELRSVFYLSEYHRLDQSRQEFGRRASELTDALQSRRAQLASIDAEGAELEQRLSRLDESLAAGEAQLLDLQSELSTLAERITQGVQRGEEYAAERTRQENRIREVAEAAVNLRDRMERDRQGASGLVQAVEAASSHIEALRNEHSAASARLGSAQQNLESAKAAVFDAARREALLSGERQNVASQRERLAAQIHALRTRIAGLEEEAAEIESERGRAVAGLEDVEKQLAGLKARLAETDGELARLAAERGRLEREVQAHREHRSAILSRLTMLEDMERRLEGVNDAVRSVLEWQPTRDPCPGSFGGDAPEPPVDFAAGQQPPEAARPSDASQPPAAEPHRAAGSVVGLVADVLRINHPDVHVLQPVLDRFENYLVVESIYAFLSELSRRPALSGPVGILALDRIDAPRGAAGGYRDAAGFVACARDWVACEPRFAALADHLLGRVMIVETVEHALAMASGAADGFIFITREGFVVESDGRVTAGGRQAVQGLISRKTEIRQLGIDLEQVESNISLLERERNAIAERISDAELARSGILDEVTGAQRREGELRSRLARCQDDAARVAKAVSLVRGDLESAQSEAVEAARQAERLEAEAETVSLSQREQEGRIAELESALDLAERDTAAISERLTAARVELGRAVERKAAADAALDALARQAASLDQEHQQALSQLEALDRRTEQLARDVEEARGRHVQVGRECEGRRTELAGLREERHSIRGRIDHGSAASRSVQAEIEQLDGALNGLRVDEREVAVRAESLVQRVREELATDLAQLYRSYDHVEQDWDAVRAEIDQIRAKMERLGNVNLDSIAELEQLAPRYENLVAQRDDLQNSIARLQSLIEELNRESRERFLATFEAIRNHFRELFRKLFGGGKADIILENPEDPLECGIEIIARPPGKEPQSISLLSGGEKTMAAVALLLAVFKSRPSPFTLMDEVDAALDESNNERFNAVLQEFLTESQFIIVTHSKVTMHAADALYGVTMEEAGVSKRVSVRFDERLPEPVQA